jgi:hypothetical protein
VSGYDFNPQPENVPDTKPAFSGGPPDPPPRPPKLTANDLLDPGGPGSRIFVPEFIPIRELAGLLELKSFKVVADILELGIFKTADQSIDFATAAKIARKRGFIAEPVL